MTKLAMHSAANPGWGTPMLLLSFAQRVLRPAAPRAKYIDLDYASSAYWQLWWPGQDAPATFLDGSAGRDVRVEADRWRLLPRGGTGFCNPPGLDGGKMVQRCWEIFEADHRSGQLGSGVWIGFSLEHFASLQKEGKRNPLSVKAGLVTVVPSRRARYLLSPAEAIGVLQQKLKKRVLGSPKHRAELKRLHALQARKDDTPVPGNAPSHASYVTVLLSTDKKIRQEQRAVIELFLTEQRQEPKSLLHRCEVIG
jgi:hypothetical protein